MDDKSSILNVDGASALEVVCEAPGIGAKIRESSFSRRCLDGAEK